MTGKLKITEVNIDNLKASTFNPNIVSPSNEKKLEESLKRFGFFRPILARELEDGSLEIVGGEHRVDAAKKLGYKTVPTINLGKITEKRAKELMITDNARYGLDDTLQLAQLLESLGADEDIASFMPYDDKDLENIFSSVNIAIDDLELGDEDEKPPVVPTRKVQEFQMMKFRVPVADAATVMDRIEAIMKAEKFNDADSLTNAGLALVQLCHQK